MFCEIKGFDLLAALRSKHRAQILNFVSMLLINLKRQECVVYVLAQPLLSELISEVPNFKAEDELGYYVSLLKSLAIRIDSSTVSLFYNSVSVPYKSEKLSLSFGLAEQPTLQPS